MRIDPTRLRSITVLFEDDDLLAVSKPPGMAVHGGAKTDKTVVALLTAAYDRPCALHLVHRLDRGTSGALLLAKSKQALKTITASWSQVTKRYLAIAQGSVSEQTINRALEDREGRAQRATTHVKPIGSLDRLEPICTLLSVTLETGRTHQIRRHLSAIGHPLMMDDKYGDFRANKTWGKALRDAGAPRPKHVLLHANVLELPNTDLSRARPHPEAIVAPPPPIWEAVMKAAGKDRMVDVPGQVS